MKTAQTSAKAYRAGQEAMSRGDLQSAKTSFHCARTLEPKNANFILAAASAASRMGEFTEAEALYREAIACAGETVGAGHPLVAVTAHGLVEMYESQGRADDAEALSKQTISVLDREEAAHANGENLARMAVLFVKAGRPEEAEQLYRSALDYRRKRFGDSHNKVKKCEAELRDFLRKARNSKATRAA